MPVGDAGFDRLFSSLEASFEAAVAAEDDVAGADLAMSLRQGRGLSDIASRSGPLVVLQNSGARLPVASVGRDFVVGAGPENRLFPIDRTVLAPGDGSAPQQIESTMIEVLRGLARRQGHASLELTNQWICAGTLVAVGPDHLSLSTPAGDLLIGLGAIASIGFDGGVDRD